MVRGLVLALSLAVPLASVAERRNILLVMTDDQGLGDSSFTGDPVPKTSNLDRCARSAIRDRSAADA